MTAKIIPISKEKLDHFKLLKKLSDNELLRRHSNSVSMVHYYENADSYRQAWMEKEYRKTAEKEKEHIEEYIRRFRPRLKGML